MAIFGLFSSGKTKGNKKAAAKKLTNKVMRAKKSGSKKRSKTCEFC